MEYANSPREVLLAIRATGLTQLQVAEKTGIPQPTLSKIERGAVDDVLSRTHVALVSLHEAIQKETSSAIPELATKESS